MVDNNFFNELGKHINNFMANYTCLPNIGEESKTRYCEYGDFDIYLYNELNKINSTNQFHQKINGVTELYNNIAGTRELATLPAKNGNFDTKSPLTIFNTKLYPSIVYEYIILYFTKCINKQMESYLRNIVEKCIKETFSKSFKEVIAVFINKCNDTYMKLDSNIKIVVRDLFSNCYDNCTVIYQVENLENKKLDTLKNTVEQKINRYAEKQTYCRPIDKQNVENRKDIEIELEKLSKYVKNTVKDINDDIDMGQLTEMVHIINKYKQVFSHNNNVECSDEINILKFKLYYLYHYHNLDSNVKKRLVDYYDILFNQRMALDKDMIRYFTYNKNKFDAQRLKNITNDIYMVILGELQI